LCGLRDGHAPFIDWISDEPFTGVEALGANSKLWSGATHEEMNTVITKVNPELILRWRPVRPSTPRGFFRAVSSCWNGTPVLATTYCTHRRYKVSDWHAFVLTDVASDRVHILDPLGRKPVKGHFSNVEARLEVRHPSNGLYILGADWEIDFSYPIWIGALF
jgi:hypothetical protein